MKYGILSLLTVVGVIHLMPITGVFGAASLHKLYGVSVKDPTLLLLMRHRAVMFGGLGGFMVVAAWVPSLHLVAIVLGLGSAASFLALAWGSPSYAPSIGKIVVADWFAVACLVVAVILWWVNQPSKG